MSDITLEIAPEADLVRTARLVATSVARGWGMHEESVDDVRLAVGEAVGLAVAKAVSRGNSAPIRIAITTLPETFQVVVSSVEQGEGLAASAVGSPAESLGTPGISLDGEDPVDTSELALALITALVPECERRADGSLALSWEAVSFDL